MANISVSSPAVSVSTIITEQPNALTQDLDLADARGIVRLLRQCDAQVFAGWGPFVSLNDKPTFESLRGICQSLKKLLTSGKKVKVIMSGAGTSGRLAWAVARSLNNVTPGLGSEVVFDYLMAGGDLALIKSIEAGEDDINAAVADLQAKVTEGDKDGFVHYIYIGITCGMSAPYVGGQLNYTINGPDADRFTTILMGFNDVAAARKVQIEKWNKTMHDVVSQLASLVGDGRHFIVNPIVGPEPVTGSSRMKGGTVTKILLEALFVYLFQICYPAKVLPEEDRKNQKGVNEKFFDFGDLFNEYERANRFTYLPEDALGAIVQAAGDSLKSGGHIYYLAEEPLSILGMIDATENPPTYGAQFTDIRGFVFGGWTTMRATRGDLTKLTEDPHYKIDTQTFITDVIPNLNDKDLVVLLHADGMQVNRIAELTERIVSKSPSTRFALVSWTRTGHAPNDFSEHQLATQRVKKIISMNSPKGLLTCSIALPYHQLLSGLPSLVEISCKWVLNAISTGAHVLKGKVYRNRMIDLAISNNKLYYRGANMVAEIAGIPQADGATCLQKAIHNTDDVSAVRDLPVGAHNEAALRRKSVVPIAILLASGKYQTVKAAEDALKEEPILRSLLQRVLQK